MEPRREVHKEQTEIVASTLDERQLFDCVGFGNGHSIPAVFIETRPAPTTCNRPARRTRPSSTADIDQQTIDIECYLVLPSLTNSALSSPESLFFFFIFLLLLSTETEVSSLITPT